MEHVSHLQWQFGNRRLTVRGGYRQMNKQLIYMDMQRKDRDMLEYHVSAN